MKEKKDKTLLYIVSTLGFIILGIILTGVINSTKKTSDIRTRASATSGISATAIVSDIKSDTQSITVTQLRFASSVDKDMGNWNVKSPAGFTLTSLSVGNTVQLTIDPPTVSIQNHTLTAKEIKKK